MNLSTGKLPVDLIDELSDQVRRRTRDDSVLIGPGVGKDAAVFRMGESLIAAKTDPITFVAENIGWYLTHVNANDVASIGADPRWLLATVLLPENTATDSMIREINAQILSACESIDVSFCGGHTEVVAGLDRPIAVGMMIGIISGDPLSSDRVEPGDLLLLTKYPAIEATSIIAREKFHVLKEKFDDETISRAANMLFDPGISVVREAKAVRGCPGLHAMHDPTEGGLINGVLELCMASSVDAVIWREKIPVPEITAEFCSLFGLDPLRSISSGSLLVAVAPDHADEACELIRAKGVECRIIGETFEGNGKLYIDVDGVRREVFYQDSDEICKLFDTGVEIE